MIVSGVAVGNVLMLNSLSTLDMRASNASINRIAMLMQDDMIRLQQIVKNYAYTAAASDAINNLVSHPEMDPEAAVESFAREYLNSTVFYEHGTNITYWAMLDVKYDTKYAVYYPKGPEDTGLVGSVRHTPAPVISPGVYKTIVKEAGRDSLITKMLIPDQGDDKPMLISLEPIVNAMDPGSGVQGFLVGGRAILPRMKQYCKAAPSCIVVQDGSDGTSYWDDVDLEEFDKVVPGTFGANKTYGGAASFIKREKDVIQETPGRICPDVPLFGDTDPFMVGYFKLCGLDPEQYKENAHCVWMRVDRPRTIKTEGTGYLFLYVWWIITLVIVFCIVFVFLLDRFVLRRIVNLSNVIRNQTDADAQKDEGDPTVATMAQEKAPEGGQSGKSSSAKSGKSASGTSADTHTTESYDSAPRRKADNEEIENLRHDMEQNALALRKRLDAVDDSIRTEQQKIIRQKQAVQLLNLWCVRRDFFPGLRPFESQLPYEYSSNLDELLSNPLAVEFLKSHCENDRTLENLWFVLDVFWLRDLESAEDNETDAAKRDQIHDVAACTAKTIMERYIVEDAPQMINVCAATFQKLRENGDHYTRNMFDDAVGEVKLMINTDILPRFRKTGAFSAMCQTLFAESIAGVDDSEFSSESVSTAGSVLTDVGEEGVAQAFANTFKNLNTAFEVGPDESSVFSASSYHPSIAQSTVKDHLSADSGDAKEE